MLLMLTLLLAACSSEEDLPQQKVGKAIALEAKVLSPETRAGGTGTIDYSVLARSGYGFGVFAYKCDDGFTNWTNKQFVYTGSESNPVRDLEPVHLHSGNWTATGVDWPRHSRQAISFLAYAPYVSAGSGPTGITAVSGSAVDNTKVTYAIATTPTDAVDLLWAVREDANRAGNIRLPWLNTSIKDSTSVVQNVSDGNVTLTFHHALSAIAFHVQTMIDKTNDTGDLGDESDVTGVLGTDYKITIKKLTLSGNFYPNAKLNLNNTVSGVPLWQEHTASASNTLTVANSLVNAAFKHPDDASPTSVANATAIMDGSMTGVTQEAEQLLIAPVAMSGTPTYQQEQCFMVIPNSEVQTYTLTIDWCVSHKKDAVYTAEDHSSNINIPSSELPLVAGTKYYINLVFGLKSVNFTITATDWNNETVNSNITIDHGTSGSESLGKKRK